MLSVNCVTLRVQKYVVMIETTSTINNEQWDLDVHDDSHTFHEDLYRLNHIVKDSKNPIFQSFCLTVFYLPEI
jgi:ribosomal protein L31